MGAKAQVGGNGELFVGEDKTFALELLDADDVPVNMSGWTIQFVVQSAKGEVLIDETATVSGTYSSTRASNTQRASVTLSDSELQIAAGTHQHSWKRTNDGSESILAYGPFIIEQTTQV